MMTPKEYAELLDYINENHGWDKLYTNTVDKKVRAVKYVTCSCDTRDGQIWIINIGFRDVVNPISSKNNVREISFNENECTIDNIKNWLNNKNLKE